MRSSYPLFMVYLDLGELGPVFRGRWLWSTRGAGARRASNAPTTWATRQCRWIEAVRDLVEAANGRRPAGPIRLLTHLRYFGHCFNPVSFYYCFDAAGEQVRDASSPKSPTRRGASGMLRACAPQPAARRRVSCASGSPRRFHVSPFMPMELDYDWRFSEPGEASRRAHA